MSLADELIKEEEKKELTLSQRIMQKVRIFLCLEGQPPKKIYTAKQASLMANGKDEFDDKQRVKDFIAEVNEFIKEKTEIYHQEEGSYEIEKTVLRYKAEIMDYFKKKGYEVHDMKQETKFVKKDLLWFDWSSKF